MKTSTEISSLCARVSHEKALEMLGQAGFDAFDLSLFEMGKYDWANRRMLPSSSPFLGPDALKYARHIRQVGLDNGLTCNQSHAPFPVCCPDIRKLLPRALECAAEAGAEICVVHPDNDKSAEENAEMFRELLPLARQLGVKIATENMWNWNAQHVVFAHVGGQHHAQSGQSVQPAHRVNDPFLVACVDVGHAEMRGLGTSAEQMIRTLGRHVQALHIHDTDRHHDNHQLPLTMQIDYDPILRALHDVGYQGYFTLEADSYLPGLPDDQLMQGVRSMQLADRFERL